MEKACIYRLFFELSTLSTDLFTFFMKSSVALFVDKMIYITFRHSSLFINIFPVSALLLSTNYPHCPQRYPKDPCTSAAAMRIPLCTNLPVLFQNQLCYTDTSNEDAAKLSQTASILFYPTQYMECDPYENIYRYS